jgi:hypothetical protein
MQQVKLSIPDAVVDVLLKRAKQEGRTVSNLAAYLLERETEGYVESRASYLRSLATISDDEFIKVVAAIRSSSENG